VSLSSQPAGEADQRASLEGCLNEWLFNGIWRARATKVEPFDEIGLKGWAVDFEVRNATNRTLEAWNAGFKDSSSLTLAFADGSTQRMEGNALARESYEAKIYNAAIPQGAGVTTRLKHQQPHRRPHQAPCRDGYQQHQAEVQPGLQLPQPQPPLQAGLLQVSLRLGYSPSAFCAALGLWPSSLAASRGNNWAAVAMAMASGPCSG
jgi:hypothetical protein